MPERYWSTYHKHNFRWDQVAKVYWSRYPNPNSKHVFTEDFIDVKVDENNCLRTTRVIMKTNSLPWWGKHLFTARKVAMVEEAVVDPKLKTLTTYTRNIGLRRFMGVTEKVTFTTGETEKETKVFKEVWIDSEVVGLRRAIRAFGIERFKKNCILATEGFDWVLQKWFSSKKIDASKSFSSVKTYTNQLEQQN